MEFQLLAKPLLINFLIFAPLIAYLSWKNKLQIKKRILFVTAIFAIAFAFVESSVVVYLRAATGLDAETYAGVIINELTKRLFTIEIFREIATIIMLLTIALLAVNKTKERTAVFLWAFAFWDIFYYVWLRVIIGWPQSLLTQDVLFLIPVPWTSQVWFPILISLLTIFAVLLSLEK